MNVEILQCQGCGSPIRPDNTDCEYCGSHNIVVAKKSPYDISDALCKQYVKHLKPTAIQDDVTSKMAIAMFYIRLKLYDLAISTLNRVIEISPDDSEAYYYLALSTIKGRRLKVLPMSDVKNIVRLLNAAIAIDDSPKYIYLKAILYYDYYHLNSLVPPDNDYHSIFTDAKDSGTLQATDIQELHANLVMTDDIMSLMQ